MTHITKEPIAIPPEVSVAAITPADLPAVVRMLDDFAVYEQVTEPVCCTVESLDTIMFGPRPILSGFIARQGSDPAGVVLFYETCSTFAATKRLFIEDLFVSSNYRGGGVGRLLMAAVARCCLTRGYGGVHWRVLETNAPGIRFYGGIGAAITRDHRACALSGHALQAFANNPLPKPQPALRFTDNGGRMLNRSA